MKLNRKEIERQISILASQINRERDENKLQKLETKHRKLINKLLRQK